MYKKIIHYSNVLPTLTFNKRNGVINSTLCIHTRSYPYLHALRDLFYHKVDNKYVKYISENLIYYLNQEILAYWAIDDGTKTRHSGFRLHTNGFTFDKVIKLELIIHYKFDLFCTIQNANGQLVNNIRVKSIPLFVELVTAYFDKSMYYKLSKDIKYTHKSK